MPDQTSPEHYGDLEKTRIIDILCNVSNEQRNENWEDDFLLNVGDASFAAGNPQVIAGPDQSPYFHLTIPEPGKKFQCFVLKHMKDDFLIKNGFGVVIHPSKGRPDWVFTLGDIVSFHLYGVFYPPKKEVKLPAEETIEKENEVTVGQPSEQFLPKDVRAALSRYLIERQVRDAKILLMGRANEGEFFEELVFNLTLEQFESKEQMDEVMRGMLWYLPKNYHVATMAESSMAEHFKPL